MTYVARNFLAPILLAGLLTPAGAFVLTHSGDADPAAQGWQAYRFLSGSEWNHTATNDVGPVNDNGTPAWQIRDTESTPDGSIQASEELSYRATDGMLDPENNLPRNFLRTNYWRFSAHVKAFPRIPHPNDPDVSKDTAMMQVNTFTRRVTNINLSARYHLSMFDNEAGGTEIQAGSHTATIPAGYNWIEMIFDPTDAAVDLFVNGELEHEDITPTSVASFGNMVRWGDGVSVNGGFGGANWSYAEFAHDAEPLAPIGVPEPGVLSLITLGAAGLAHRRRR